VTSNTAAIVVPIIFVSAVHFHHHDHGGDFAFASYLDRSGLAAPLVILLFGAVLGREAARALTAAWHNLSVRSILLLPIGGLFSYSSPEM